MIMTNLKHLTSIIILSTNFEKKILDFQKEGYIM